MCCPADFCEKNQKKATSFWAPTFFDWFFRRSISLEQKQFGKETANFKSNMDDPGKPLIRSHRRIWRWRAIIWVGISKKLFTVSSNLEPCTDGFSQFRNTSSRESSRDRNWGMRIGFYQIRDQLWPDLCPDQLEGGDSNQGSCTGLEDAAQRSGSLGWWRAR